MTSPLNVYVVSRARGPCKVGISDNPLKRIRGLPGDGAKLSLVGTYPRHEGDARLVERVAHQLLADKRHEGEWFNVTEAEAVAAVQEAISLVDSNNIPEKHRTIWTRMVFICDQSLLDRIDDWRFANRAKNQAEAIRKLVIAGLDAVEGLSSSKDRRTPKVSTKDR